MYFFVRAKNKAILPFDCQSLQQSNSSLIFHCEKTTPVLELSVTKLMHVPVTLICLFF